MGKAGEGGNIWSSGALGQLFPWMMNLLTNYLSRPCSGWALRLEGGSPSLPHITESRLPFRLLEGG